MTAENVADQQDFTNQQIAFDDLPDVNDPTFSHLEPAYFWTALGMWVVVTLAILGGATLLWLASYDNAKAAIVLPIIALMASVGAVAVALLNIWEITKKGYAMREHDILFRKGLVWRSITAVPFSRVQHVETHRGPIDRLVGLSELKIYTAGGQSSDLKIPGLTIQRASALRQSILNHAYEDGAAVQRPAGVTEAADKDSADV